VTSDYPTLILLNGPPRCGKDTAAKIIAERSVMRTFPAKFASMLKSGAQAALGLNPDPAAFEAVKDDPQGYLNDHTWRQVWIKHSEEYMKPLYGDSIFGALLGAALRDMYARDDFKGPVPGIVTVSDSGFRGEAEELLHTTTWGDDEALFQHENVILVRLHRTGCTFEGDSRGYISLATEHVPLSADNPAAGAMLFSRSKYEGVREYDIINDGDDEYDLELKLAAILGRDLMRPMFHQLQVQIPCSGDATRTPGWAVFRDDVEALEDAQAFLQGARETAYANRITRIVRGRKVIQTVWPEDEPVYDFGQETRVPLCQDELASPVPLEEASQ